MENDVQRRAITVIAEQMGVDAAEISYETRFAEDLNADSLDAVELVMEVEDTFHISIPDDDAQGIRTVGDAIEVVRRRLDEDGGAGVAARLKPPKKPPGRAEEDRRNY